jgi:DNA-binding PadR family transcriptional regulator
MLLTYVLGAYSREETAQMDHRPLSYVEINILLALAKADMHGYAIMQDAAERTGGVVRLEPGNLYRALQRMERNGWVSKAARRPDPEVHGERRRHYTLNEAGRAVAAAETARMESLVRTARQRAIDEPGSAR